MNHHSSDNCSKWYCEKLMQVAENTRVADILLALSGSFRQFLVLTNAAGEALAVLSTEEFLQILESLRNSRFPGDVDPTSLTMDQLQGYERGDFYRWNTTMPYSWFLAAAAPPARHVLVLEGPQIRAVVPRADFAEWWAALRGSLQTEAPLRRDQAP
jgi:hypothetical protein